MNFPMGTVKAGLYCIVFYCIPWYLCWFGTRPLFSATPLTSFPPASQWSSHVGLLFTFPGPHSCHWQELPQVSFLSWQKTCFVRIKLLSWQMWVCCNKSFVATKICLSRQKFCRDKHTFVATEDVFCGTNTCLSRQNFCRDKHILVFVVTNVCLSRQNFCRDKIMFVATNICHNNSFVTTKVFCFSVSLPPMMKDGLPTSIQTRSEQCQQTVSKHGA